MLTLNDKCQFDSVDISAGRRLGVNLLNSNEWKGLRFPKKWEFKKLILKSTRKVITHSNTIFHLKITKNYNFYYNNSKLFKVLVSLLLIRNSIFSQSSQHINIFTFKKKKSYKLIMPIKFIYLFLNQNTECHLKSLSSLLFKIKYFE